MWLKSSDFHFNFVSNGTQNHISCSGQIKFVVVQHDIRHYGSITDIKENKKRAEPHFLRNVPYKRFPKQGAKKLCPFRFLCVWITLGLKIEKTHQLCAKLQGSVIIHYTGLTCLIISIFLPILNTHFGAKSQNGNFDGFYYRREFFLENYHMQYANSLLLYPWTLFL